MSQSSDSCTLLSPSEYEPAVGNAPPPPPLPGEGSQGSRKSHRSMGLPSLSTPPADSGDTDGASRFITLDERLAEHVQRTKPRGTPGRSTRATFNRQPLPTRESAVDEQKDDGSPLPQQRTSATPGFNSIDYMARAVPRTIGMAVGGVDERGTGMLASLRAAAGFVEYTLGVEDMCEFTNSADLEWELFIEGLGHNYPSNATADVPAPIRTLFVAHAKKAASAIAEFRHELWRGES
jgi:hypothetical protein